MKRVDPLTYFSWLRFYCPEFPIYSHWDVNTVTLFQFYIILLLTSRNGSILSVHGKTHVLRTMISKERTNFVHRFRWAFPP